MVDPDGNIPFFLITAAIGAVAGAVVGGIIAAKNGGNVWAGIGIGAAAGGLIGLGAGAVASAMLAGSVTATAIQVAGGASLLYSTVSAGGLGAGLTYLEDNFSRTFNGAGTSLYSGGERALQAAKDSGGLWWNCYWKFNRESGRNNNQGYAMGTGKTGMGRVFCTVLWASKWRSKCIHLQLCIPWSGKRFLEC